MKAFAPVVRWGADSDAARILSFQREFGKKNHGALFLDRSPDLFRSYAAEGQNTRLIVAERPDSGAITGCAALSYKMLHVHGDPTPSRVGYLGSLATIGSGLKSLQDGFDLIKSLPTDEQAALYLTTIFSSNKRALRVLGSGKAGIGACYRPLGSYTTILFKANQLARRNADKTPDVQLLRHADLSDTTLNGFVSDTVAKWQSFPAVTFSAETPRETVRAGDSSWIYVGNGAGVRAIGSLWDYRLLKRWQYTMRGIVGSVGKVSHLLRASILGLPYLKSIQEKLLFIQSRLADPNDFDGQWTVLQELSTLAVRRFGDDVSLCFGLHERDPLLSKCNRLNALRIESQLFQVVLNKECVDFDSRPWYLDPGGL